MDTIVLTIYKVAAVAELRQLNHLKMPSNEEPKLENLKISDDYETYKLGNFKLKSGGEIPDAFIAYKTLGDPSLPAIIYPTWYSGR